MKSILKNKGLIFLTFLVFYLITEITTFIWIDFDFLPKDLLIDFMIVFAISSITLLIKSNKGSIIYISVIYALVLILFVVNATMYKVYMDLFTIQQLLLISEATDVVQIEHISFWSIGIAIGYGLIYFFVIRLVYKNLPKIQLSKELYYRKALISFGISMLMIFGFFSINSVEINDFVTNDNVSAFKRASLSEYGLLGYYTKEIENLVFQDSYCSFANPVLSEDNDYTGILEGKNVITILLESVQPFAINETLTPNMYQMTQEGLYFEESYSENKTNHSELIAILGNYPMTSVNFNSYTYDYSYGMPQVLSELGYKTTYLHDNVASFYSRGTLMPELGFENLYLHEELYPGEEIWTWNGDYTLDSLTMEKMLPYISDTEEPFYSFWATLSTHGPYDYGYKNKRLFDQMGYFDAIDQAEEDGLWINILGDYSEEDALRIRHYQAAVMNLDDAIGMLLTDLEEKGILDDTVIVMYGDHNVYYHEIYLKRFEGNNEIYNMSMYENFFVMYNSDLTNAYLENSGDTDTTIDDFVSPYNIVPTLYDLLGIEYDTNMFIGTSIFDDEDDVFYSIKLTSFFDNNYFSDDGKTILYNKNNLDEISKSIFIENCEIIKDKIAYINRVYRCSREKLDE